MTMFFFFSSRRRHTRFDCDWSSDVCSSDLVCVALAAVGHRASWQDVRARQRHGYRSKGVLCRSGSSDATRSEEQRLNSSHSQISYAVFCLKKKKNKGQQVRVISADCGGALS